MLQPIFLLMVLIFLNAVFASAEIAVISMSDLNSDSSARRETGAPESWRRS